MKDRIRQVRKAKGLTQTEFGDIIGVKGNTITNYEKGMREPSDAVIRGICREFGVSEHWLRTGDGEMFLKDNDTSSLLARLEEENDPFIIDVIRAYMNLNENGKQVLRDMCDDLRHMQNDREQT